MGYDVYITRQNNWWQKEEAQQISEAEWKAAVESDAEMRLCGAAEATFPSAGTLRYENPLLAEWLGHPEHKAIWFDFRRGNVVVKNPDAAMIAKMKQLALKLKARVQGDEGEFYD